MATVSEITKDAALESHLLWDQYKNTIIAVVAVLLLGAVGYAGFQFYHARRAADASALLAAAKSPQDYQQVIDRFPEQTCRERLSSARCAAAREEELCGSEHNPA
jgi:predicted negative regulator of RcsB-dependent stress response